MERPGTSLLTHVAAALASVQHGPLVVGFSGGPDSTALLHALAHLDAARSAGLRALHVNHHLHADATRWAADCHARCAQWAVPLRVLDVKVDAASGLGIEGAARQARHWALQAALQPDEWLVFAHHADDQAETLLMRLLRGSGVDGMAAMRALRPFGPGMLWRPLLACPRQHLLDHLLAHGLDAIDDPSNVDPRHDRAWLRQRLMPLLASRWPDAAMRMSTGAQRIEQDRVLLADGDGQVLAEVRTLDPAVLDIDLLQRHPPQRQLRVVRAWVRDLGLPPLPGTLADRLDSEVLQAAPDAQAQLRWHGARIERWGDLLRASIEVATWPPTQVLRWDGRDALTLPGDAGTLRFEGTAPPWPMHVRPRRGGERLRLPGRAHGTPLKTLLQDHQVPSWERRRLPILCRDGDDTVLAAGDLFVGAELDDWLQLHHARLRWQPAS